ncbi:hypothetical protein HMSSN139_57720 [Paenibacillus sp. HMSSN-139]|nr:hypothetical protein HMSSN139_57720 [Paenibacillus sp. HMSSN-139]
MTRSELAGALSKVASELERERSAQAERKLAEWKLSRYLEEMKEQFIHSVIKAYPGGSHIWQERIRLFGLSELAAGPVRFVSIGLPSRRRRRAFVCPLNCCAGNSLERPTPGPESQYFENRSIPIYCLPLCRVIRQPYRALPSR